MADETGGSKLDPADWDAFRLEARRLLDAAIDRMARARMLPWKEVGPEARQRLMPPLPQGGQPLTGIVNTLIEDVMPYATGNTHPRFFGWVHGTGLASAFLAEMAASAMNSNCGGRDHGAVYVERAVMDWCRQIFGMAEGSSGVLTTGTSQATLIALVTARHRLTGGTARREGIRTLPPMRVYAAAGAHQCVTKALEAMGHGAAALRTIATEGPAAGMNLERLSATIEEDKRNGDLPLAVVATAGSVDAGAFDRIEELADFCARTGLWLHVDGAFGAWICLADQPWRGLAAGIGRADSIAFDFHKWVGVQYDCGGVLLRDGANHHETFASRPGYLAAQQHGLGGGDPWFCDYGLELSRGFRALKVWTVLQSHGLDAIAASITQNCRQAAYLADRLRNGGHFRVPFAPPSNVCVFGIDRSDMSEEQRSACNRAICERLQLEGTSVFSTTRIGGEVFLRAAIVNHRTTFDDIDLTVAALDRALETLSPDHLNSHADQ
ncbi:aspartate aminotransferase family protein [Ciceribacter sp. RN22]|uniref:pyridoxal phosphate-dependent decarboxylase family protein n=1 Tax=Ciceribacter sp. RN22 TaxID=2954932 RepID=UPI002092EDD0|nr:pyridoxal-dependent decarboxylase [Ciceribacter sp. RN22]MCO6177484.1 pyridoxal-dependent decarboxylase [Ciceribacter sp. RN22]